MPTDTLRQVPETESDEPATQPETPSDSDSSDDEDLSDTELENACSTLLCEMVEDVILGVCFNVHRALKFGYYALEEYVIENGEFVPYDPVRHNENHDTLAIAAATRKPSTINCPHCKRKVGTNRFAPHLNSCMGDGGRAVKDRNAKRNFQTYESDDDDDDEDYSDSGKKKKKKPAKNARKGNKLKGKAVQVNVFLAQKCGVISRKSKSMCNNTLKCSIHSEEQRKEVRRTLLKVEPDSNVHIDVDTVDEGSRSPSPAELAVCDKTLSVKLEDVNTTTEHPKLTPMINP